MRLEVHGRDVLVLLNNNQPYALDAVCYHAGGPLIEGDIEEVAERTCLVCPWHHYKVDIKTGEGLYNDLEAKLCSKGVKQRTHEVKVEEDVIFVGLSKNRSDLASDHYAMMGLWKFPTSKTPAKLHSGMVFQKGTTS